MEDKRRIFDKKWLILGFISLFFSLLIILFLPTLTPESNFSSHITFNYYLNQLYTIIPFLSLSIFLFSILPLRKFLDYRKIINRFNLRSYLLIIFLISFIITNLISFFFYSHLPQGDSVVTYFQAKIFSQGHLWVTSPAYPDFFQSEMVINNGKWFSMAQHGHSLLLAPFMLIKTPWLLSPLIGSFSLIIFFLFLRNCFDEKLAREGTLLLLLSPMFLSISSSFLNQNSSFLLILLSLFFLSLSIKYNNNIFPFFAGIFCGLAFFSRTTVVAFIPPMIILILSTRREKRWQTILLFLLGLLPTFAIQLIDNLLYTGNIFRFAYSLHTDSMRHSIGFGLGKGAPTFNIQGHTPLKALINLLYNIFAFSLHLFGWPLVSLFFIPFAFLRWKKNRWDIFALAVIVLSVAFFAFYWFHGISPMGPKYYFGVVPLLILLTMRGIKKLNIRPFITLLMIFNILIYIPFGLRIFNTVWGTNNRCYKEIRKKSIHNAIVFIEDLPGKNEYEKTINRHNYLSVAFRNEPELSKGNIIYAKDLGGEKNMLLINQYKQRKPYIFKYEDGGSKWVLIPYF